jgi:uncharacterized protein involved in exopolysaccharide biosynthesis
MTDSPSTAAGPQEDISLVDIVDFFREGWRSLVTITCISGALGLATAFLLPVKYESRALIQSAKAVGKEVEPVKVLAEKMRSPSYYSEQTIKACQVEQRSDPADFLTRGLNPRVSRDSSFVAVAFREQSTIEAEACLNSVLADVIRQQAMLAKPMVEKTQNDLALTQQRLKAARLAKEQEISQNTERLKVAREKLAAAVKFVSEFESRALTFDFKDERFSASSLMLATVVAKQAEIKDLQVTINDLESRVRLALTGREDDLLKFETMAGEMTASLRSPATEEARFAAPIYSNLNKAEPKRSLILAISLIAGLMLGLAYLIGRRLTQHLRSQRIARTPIPTRS